MLTSAKFSLNTPVLLRGTPTDAVGLGDAGTLKDAVDDVFDQVGAYTIIIRVEEGLDLAATLSNLVGDATTPTGVHALLKCAGISHVLLRCPASHLVTA
ncbi:MAG: phage tail sheath protein FI [Paracoccaceae bacterium]|jgi:phage tail sheath protein FI